MDRALVFGTRGCGFESCRARQGTKKEPQAKTCFAGGSGEKVVKRCRSSDQVDYRERDKSDAPRNLISFPTSEKESRQYGCHQGGTKDGPQNLQQVNGYFHDPAPFKVLSRRRRAAEFQVDYRYFTWANHFFQKSPWRANRESKNRYV